MRSYILTSLKTTATASTLALLPALIGCGGDLGGYENIPGEDTVLGSFKIAVDDRNDNIFWLNEKVETVGENEDGSAVTEVAYRGLFRLDPDTLEPRYLLDLSEMSYPTLSFVGDTLLISGNTGKDSEWYRLHRDRLEVTDHQVLENDTTLGSVSPSGKAFLAGGWPTYYCNETLPEDDCVLTAPARVTLVDAYTTEKHELELGETLFVSRWLHDADIFVVTVFGTDETPEANPYTRVLAWNYTQLSSNRFQIAESGLWADPMFDLTLNQTSADLATFFTDLAVSPDDHTLALAGYRNDIVYAVQEDGTTIPTTVYTPELHVIELSSGAHQVFVDARGPVGFTPDSSTLVAYVDGLSAPQGSGEAADPLPEETPEGTQILMIDREDLSYESLALEGVDDVSFYVTREGSFLVVDTYTYSYDESTQLGTSSEQLLVYDVDSGEYVTVASDPELDVDLYEFISRPGHQEIWSVDEGKLYRLGYAQGALEQVATEDGYPNLIHYLPNRDRLVLGEVDEYPANTRLWLLDATTQDRVGPVMNAPRY